MEATSISVVDLDGFVSVGTDWWLNRRTYHGCCGDLAVGTGSGGTVTHQPGLSVLKKTREPKGEINNGGILLVWGIKVDAFLLHYCAQTETPSGVPLEISGLISLHLYSTFLGGETSLQSRGADDGECVLVEVELETEVVW